MQPTWNNTGVAHENGDVEQSHHRFKQAVDQALRARGDRDFPTRAAYEHFLHELVRNRNLNRMVRFATEREALRPLPATALAPCKELRVTVSRFSTIARGHESDSRSLFADAWRKPVLSFLFRQILEAGCSQPRFYAGLFTTYLYTTLGM